MCFVSSVRCLCQMCPIQTLVVQSPSPSSLQIKEPPPSPGSPSSDTMYGGTGSTQIYMQVRDKCKTKDLSDEPNTRKFDDTFVQMQGPSHQNSAGVTSGSNVNANTPSPGPYVSDQYGMYTARLT